MILILSLETRSLSCQRFYCDTSRDDGDNRKRKGLVFDMEALWQSEKVSYRGIFYFTLLR